MVMATLLLMVSLVVGNIAYTKSVHDQQVATCQSGNESRKLQVQLWDYVLGFPPSRPRTEAQDKQIADFKAYVHKTFAPRDCSKI